MSDLHKLMSGNSREDSLLNRFNMKVEKLPYGAKKEGIRLLEQALLQPIALPQYTGPLPVINSFKRRSINVALPSAEHVDLWAELFRVQRYAGANTWDTEFLVELLRLLKDKRLTWDKNRKRYYYHPKNGRIKRI